MVHMSISPLIDPADLAAELAGPRPPVLLDVRWSLAGADRDGYLAGHLPGAVFVDLDTELAAQPGPAGRHPLPTADHLQRVWRRAGIDGGSLVVTYAGGDCAPAARAWWLLRWCGVAAVRVLDGGLAAWTAARLEVRGGAEAAPAPGSVTVRPGTMRIVDAAGAAEIAAGSSAGVLLDARAANRYCGEVEPVDPVAGHIPGAVNLPYQGLFGGDGRFRPAQQIRATFARAGVRGGSVVAACCGSGVTACVLVLAAEIAGLEMAGSETGGPETAGSEMAGSETAGSEMMLYPGSYSQWCAAGRPVVTGPTALGVAAPGAIG